MKGLLLLFGVGAAIYTFLVITHDALPGGEDTLNVQTQHNHPVGEHPSSWGSYLAPSPSRNPQSATSQQSAEFPAQQSDGQNSERKPGTTDQLAASADKATTSESDVMEPEGVEWAKVVLAAQMHSQASVSSPLVRFYSPGIELQLVRGEGGWLQVSDPVTHERGWILEKYLASIDGPRPAQVATETTTESLAAKPALPKSKKWSRYSKRSKPAVRVSERPRISNGVGVARWDQRSVPWARHADRRRGFGVFMFRPFGRFAAQGR
jgi:hypothetical protein